ncbi:tripartite tricarboxylate transporter substrate binding protein [Saccharospirillum alexandrii]|uniref:tripartite tricarboxylate transporter substrate binding protein n=1 Tax=Saccharospirillum alexandrii TaxID=2448477 RepID=UPI000FDBDE8C|nr:tripartite tricarboxylate transporter substrate-binding protein [Saccharospirillum alexandrii]
MLRTLFRLLPNQAARLSCLTLLCIGLSAHAESPDDLHFIIPGGEGGGWDLTARTVGQTLQEAGIVSRVSYNNLSGNSGGIAMSRLVNGPNEHPNTLMVNSTPIIVRSLSHIFDHTYQDLTPVVSLIGDYGALVVANDSDHQTFDDLVTAFKADPFHVKFGGGSARGDLDNIVVASILREAVGKKARYLHYQAYDGGGDAMAGLLSGEVDSLVTGFGEAIQWQRNNQVRILGITAPERSPADTQVPTFKEQGYDVNFVNWRGFFAPPNLPDRQTNQYIELFRQLNQSNEWRQAMSARGWVSTFHTGRDFEQFLARQERELLDVMRDLNIYYLGY